MLTTQKTTQWSNMLANMNMTLPENANTQSSTTTLLALPVSKLFNASTTSPSLPLHLVTQMLLQSYTILTQWTAVLSLHLPTLLSASLARMKLPYPSPSWPMYSIAPKIN
eukprot:7246062-Ditylum_brightwellii.AAC.1